MMIEKDAAESGSAQDSVSEQKNAKKPSLGRVAVSALYGDRIRISEDMERQRNRHTSASPSVGGGTEPPFFTWQRPALSGVFILQNAGVFVNPG
jgi:hypothetical protein